MAVLRQANFLGQQRVDVPHLRSIESAVAADFDLLAGKILGGDRALVVRGFELVGSSGQASLLGINVAGGAVMHAQASEAGTVFAVEDSADVEILNNTNPNVDGSFAPSQTNYVGLDLRRNADPTTADTVMFLDANSLQENPNIVPLARTLSYRIVISTADFSATPHVLPLAKVVTDASTAVMSVVDARQMFYRLASGGSAPDVQDSYPWPGGRNSEDVSDFSTGDKAIASGKDFNDAIMTRLWELGGGERWFSPTSDRDVKVAYGPPPFTQAQNITVGDNWFWDSGTSTIYWDNISVIFANSTATVNTLGVGGNPYGNNVLGLDQCLYVDLDRSSDPPNGPLVPVVADLQTLGAPAIPGSRFILAWRDGGSAVFTRDRAYEVNRSLQIATDVSLGVVKLSRAASTPSSPIVISDRGGSIAAPAGNNNGLTVTATGTGVSVSGVGGVNTVSSTGHVPSTFTPGPGTGGAFTGASGTFGGDGLVSFARGTDLTRNAIVGYGNGTTALSVAAGNGMAGVGGTHTSTTGNGGHGVVGNGGEGLGALSGHGGVFTGGGTGGGSTGGIGALCTGDGTSPGVHSTGGVSNGNGVIGVGRGTGKGVSGTGGAGTSGPVGTAGGHGSEFTGGVGGTASTVNGAAAGRGGVFNGGTGGGSTLGVGVGGLGGIGVESFGGAGGTGSGGTGTGGDGNDGVFGKGGNGGTGTSNSGFAGNGGHFVGATSGRTNPAFPENNVSGLGILAESTLAQAIRASNSSNVYPAIQVNNPLGKGIYMLQDVPNSTNAPAGITIDFINTAGGATGIIVGVDVRVNTFNGIPAVFQNAFPTAQRGAIQLVPRTGDPGSPQNGDMWVNNNQLKIRLNGNTIVIATG